MKHRVAITGTTGGIGRYLASYLNKLGKYKVFEINRRPLLDKTSRSLVITNYQLPEVKDFLSDNKVQSIVHLAGITDSTNKHIYQFNHFQTVFLARAFLDTTKKANIKSPKFIYSSTGAIYGDQGRTPYSEDDKLSPQSEYAHSKLIAENELLNLTKNENLTVINGRIFNAYGPGLSNSLVNRIVDGESLKIIWNENYTRDYINLADISEIIQLLLQIEVDSGPINIANGIGWNNIKLVDSLRKQMELKFQKEASEVYSYSVADVSKLKQITGYNPKTQINVVNIK